MTAWPTGSRQPLPADESHAADEDLEQGAAGQQNARAARAAHRPDRQQDRRRQQHQPASRPQEEGGGLGSGAWREPFAHDASWSFSRSIVRRAAGVSRPPAKTDSFPAGPPVGTRRRIPRQRGQAGGGVPAAVRLLDLLRFAQGRRPPRPSPASGRLRAVAASTRSARTTAAATAKPTRDRQHEIGQLDEAQADADDHRQTDGHEPRQRSRRTPPPRPASAATAGGRFLFRPGRHGLQLGPGGRRRVEGRQRQRRRRPPSGWRTTAWPASTAAAGPVRPAIPCRAFRPVPLRPASEPVRPAGQAVRAGAPAPTGCRTAAAAASQRGRADGLLERHGVVGQVQRGGQAVVRRSGRGLGGGLRQNQPFFDGPAGLLVVGDRFRKDARAASRPRSSRSQRPPGGSPSGSVNRMPCSGAGRSRRERCTSSRKAGRVRWASGSARMTTT